MEPQEELSPGNLTIDTPRFSQSAQTKAELEKLSAQVATLDTKVNILLENSDKMRRAASRSMWLTFIFVVLPILLSLIALPYFMKSFTSSLGLGGDTSSLTGLLEELQKSKGE